jgi:hypothetical protein
MLGQLPSFTGENSCIRIYQSPLLVLEAPIPHHAHDQSRRTNGSHRELPRLVAGPASAGSRVLLHSNIKFNIRPKRYPSSFTSPAMFRKHSLPTLATTCSVHTQEKTWAFDMRPCKTTTNPLVRAIPTSCFSEGCSAGLSLLSYTRQHDLPAVKQFSVMAAFRPPRPKR